MSEDLLGLALAVARDAGTLLLARADAPVSGLSAKVSSTDLVSDADRDAEERVVRAIRTARPDDAIVAEEGGVGGSGASGITWLVDPLDGTTNYLWGIPHWSVSVAACDDDGPIVGVVHDPGRDEVFSARRGHGAWLGDRALVMGPGRELSQALLGTGFNYLVDERARQARHLAGVLPAVRDVRRFGSAALDLAWVAADRLDGYFETPLNPWDRAAGELIVREAGGVVEELPGAGVIAAGRGLIGPLRALVHSAA